MDSGDGIGRMCYALRRLEHHVAQGSLGGGGPQPVGCQNRRAQPGGSGFVVCSQTLEKGLKKIRYSMATNKPTNRRGRVRFRADMPVQVTCMNGSGNLITGRMANLSVHGFSLILKSALAPGTPVKVQWGNTAFPGK